MDHLFLMASATRHIRLQTVDLPLSLFLPSTCYASVIQGISLNLLRPPGCLSRGKAPLLVLRYLPGAVCFVSGDSRSLVLSQKSSWCFEKLLPPSWASVMRERMPVLGFGTFPSDKSLGPLGHDPD